MPTERKAQEFLEGNGLNLAVPIHKDPSRALVMENWRADRMRGRIRSRLGLGSSVASYGGTIHTIRLANSSNRYVGAGTSLFRNTTNILSGLDGRRLFLVSLRGFVWIMNRNVQKKDNGTTVSDWLLSEPGSAPTVATGGAGALTGDIEYAVSFEDASGFESNIGPLSSAVTFAAEEADLSSIPTGPAGTSKRHIYRIGGGLTQSYRVATINDNSTTTYTDNLINDSAVELGILAPIDHDPPPAARGVCHYRGHLVAWSTAAHPNRIYRSGTDGPWYFPQLKYIPVGDSSEEIIACVEVNGVLAILKERSLWRLVGTFEDGDLECVSTEFGLVGESAMAIGKNVIRYASRKGIFAFSGDEPIKLSELLDPIFNGEGVAVGSGQVLQAANLQYLDKIVLESSDNLLYVSYPGGAFSINSQTAVLNLGTGEWVQDSRAFTAMHQEGPGGAFSVATGVDLWFMDNGQTDGVAPIDVTYQSAFHDFGAPDNDKQVFEVLVEHEVGAEDLTVKTFYDRDVASTPATLGTITGKGVTRFVLNGDDGVMVSTLSALAEGSVTEEVEITKIQASYILHPRKTKRWVSDVLQNLQSEVWEVRAIQMEIDPGAADFNMVLASDGLGANDLSAQETIAVTVTGTVGRRPFPRTLSASKFGRLWRMSANSTSEMRVYRALMEARQVPIYLSGPRSEFHEDPPISLGV